LEPLIDLDNIRVIQLENTDVSDLRPLKNSLQLEIVYCDETNVTTENVLEFKKALPESLVVYQSDNLNLWWSNLDDEWKNLLTEESGIDEKINRENLQRIADMTKLAIHDKLSIRKLEPLTVFLQLIELAISNTMVSDISPITSLSNLTKLEISSSPIGSIERITGLSQLKHLSIENTSVEDVEPVYQLRNLISLNISGTQVKKLKGIESLQHLEVLSINNTNIKNLKPVEELRNLKEFRCFNTSVKASKIEDYEKAHPGVNVVYY
jgi:Leucine-rich repeat (LRR) protein